MCKRMVHDFDNPGRIKIIEVEEHSYAWSGSIPCTGVYRCVYCGRPYESEEKNVQQD